LKLRTRLLRAFSAALVCAVFVAAFIPAVAAEAAPVPPFELRFPQETGVTTFSSSFGARRSGGRRHEGNDLMAPKMTQVYAASAGVISVIGTSRLSGRYIEIDHGDDWSTRYIHLNNDNPGTDDGDADWSLTLAPDLVEGSRVVAGQLIAWSGDSGNAESTGSHTHFELAFRGKAIDPYPYLKTAFRRDDVRAAQYVWTIDHPFDDRMS
jgi:murein DD-endopeptidase MepM/ murein hydrolase activator NlpD